MRYFNIEEWKDEGESLNGAYAMHCPEKWMAKEFLTYLNDQGRTWSDGKSYLEMSHWGEDHDICYLFNKGKYGTSSICTFCNIHILEYEDFDFLGQTNKGFEESSEMDGYLKELTE